MPLHTKYERWYSREISRRKKNVSEGITDPDISINLDTVSLMLFPAIGRYVGSPVCVSGIDYPCTRTTVEKMSQKLSLSTTLLHHCIRFFSWRSTRKKDLLPLSFTNLSWGCFPGASASLPGVLLLSRSSYCLHSSSDRSVGTRERCSQINPIAGLLWSIGLGDRWKGLLQRRPTEGTRKKAKGSATELTMKENGGGLAVRLLSVMATNTPCTAHSLFQVYRGIFGRIRLSVTDNSEELFRGFESVGEMFRLNFISFFYISCSLIPLISYLF